VSGTPPGSDNDVGALEEDVTPRELAPQELVLYEDNEPSASLAVAEHDRDDPPSRGDRRLFALLLLGLVAVIAITVMIAAFASTDTVWTRVERASGLILTPLLTLLGTAVGWYFGHRSTR
jgi:hypothetical protein